MAYSVSFDIPFEVRNCLPQRPDAEEAAEDCYCDLFLLMWHYDRRWKMMILTSAAFMFIATFASLRWESLFLVFNLWHITLMIVAIGLVGGLAGWHVGGIKKRNEVQETEDVLFRNLQEGDALVCQILDTICKHDPRPEYREFASWIFTRANKRYS